jgi:hypothetical protein
MSKDLNKASLSINSQLPTFIRENYPLFEKFFKYYYESQEKTGLSYDIINNLISYFDVDFYNQRALVESTTLLEPVGLTDTEIVVESVDAFLPENGSILIDDEVIYYERIENSPKIVLSNSIGVTEYKNKWQECSSPFFIYNGTTTSFDLISNGEKVRPTSVNHMIVKVYGTYLKPGRDFTINEDKIVFTTAPRQRVLNDDSARCQIYYLKGYYIDNIVAIDDIKSQFNGVRTIFDLKVNNQKYEPISDIFANISVNGNLLTPYSLDEYGFTIQGSTLIFKSAPSAGQDFWMTYVENVSIGAGEGASAISVVNDNGEIESIKVVSGGSGYTSQYTPKITISADEGSGGTALALIGGVKSISLLDGGQGYDSTNPPKIYIGEPSIGGIPARAKAIVDSDGKVSEVMITESGSNYNTTPRLTFVNPGGARIGQVTISNGIITSVQLKSSGSNYTTPPRVYVDAPNSITGVKAILTTSLNTDGEVVSVNVVSGGREYDEQNPPRIEIIDPVGAQILEVTVNSNGQVTQIDLLSGGKGYEVPPSIYIVDTRVGENGLALRDKTLVNATAEATVFNGSITDINITNFGEGYDPLNPPSVIISSPVVAKASCDIGFSEITGFRVIEPGSGYSKAKFINCKRGVSGISDYDSNGNAIFSSEKISASTNHTITKVTSLDTLFYKKIIGKFIDEFAPIFPSLDFSTISVPQFIKTIKQFYSSKGTKNSVTYFFRILFNEKIDIKYPKEQIIKPSAATWSVDTVLRVSLVSGNIDDVKDSLIEQFADPVDIKIQYASALVENLININVVDTNVIELVISKESVVGTFKVPYATKLTEKITADDTVINVDSTIGWPEKNGQILVEGEIISYKDKTLNQFLECTRGVNGLSDEHQAAATAESNFFIYANTGTSKEVILKIFGIVEAGSTELVDTGSYYLSGDKLDITKIGASSSDTLINSWLFNIKKLIEASSIVAEGVGYTTAKVTCTRRHGLLIGDQVTIYGATPILYNGTYAVTSITNTTFTYTLPSSGDPVNLPTGKLLVSIDLNKGKSDNLSINNAVKLYTSNVQNVYFNDEYTYIASTGIPSYKIGPFVGTALLPGNQRYLKRFPRIQDTISVKTETVPGPVGSWVNGISVWNYKSKQSLKFGKLNYVNISSPGSGYDAGNPPKIIFSGGGGEGASATVTVDGSIAEIQVEEGGSGYLTSPLVSIVGGGGSGASASAVITNGVVSKILVNSGGSGYTSTPNISISGGDGFGATAVAIVRGPIKDIQITDYGKNYLTEPTIEVSSGKNAEAFPIVNNGRIVSIAVVNAGSGYTSPPEVEIYGAGFGAKARATISTVGDSAGKVLTIEILNRGINYSQGNTSIVLKSVGSGAKFESKVFEWNFNYAYQTELDASNGFVFSGLNNQFGGDYAHLSDPKKLRYILGDNLEIRTGQVAEKQEGLVHSPILGWAYDGNPIYGPYGYSDPTDDASRILRMVSSYGLKVNLVGIGAERIDGPSLEDYPAGSFIQDYEFFYNSGTLDEYNGRFCKTPEFPKGTYAYFITLIEDTVDLTNLGGVPTFPYVIGPKYYSKVDTWNLSSESIQSNLPLDIVRFRDPYENVDTDLDRTAFDNVGDFITEDGELLTFEVEDTDQSGFINITYQLENTVGSFTENTVITSIRSIGSTLTRQVKATVNLFDPIENTISLRYYTYTKDAGKWQPGVQYTAGQVVFSDGDGFNTGKLYRASNTAVSGTSQPTVRSGYNDGSVSWIYLSDVGILETGDKITSGLSNSLLADVIQELSDSIPSYREEDVIGLYDYFPTVAAESKVDIEIETTTKFESAKVDGYVIENPGDNYKVGDKIVFDETGTDGYGVSARISKVDGKNISLYNFALGGEDGDTPIGTATCTDNVDGVTSNLEHNLQVGDTVYIESTPIQIQNQKDYKVRITSGIEKVEITQVGTGYNKDIPPIISISGNGSDAIIEPKLQSTGVVEKIDIVNSGNSYTFDPRLIVSHPQIFKKANYFFAKHWSQYSNVVINDVYGTSEKYYYVCGKAIDLNNNTVAIIGKYNDAGILIWQKSLSSGYPGQGFRYADFQKILVRNDEIFVVGQTRPNTTSQFNPDIIVAKYTENSTGLLATITWQKEIAGVSGAIRQDYITGIVCDNNGDLFISGYTNTNSSSPQDAYLVFLRNSGDVVKRRKISLNGNSEKITSLTIDSNGYIHFVGELLDTLVVGSSTHLLYGKAKWNDDTRSIDIAFIKDITCASSIVSPSIKINEFDDLIIAYNYATSNTFAILNIQENSIQYPDTGYDTITTSWHKSFTNNDASIVTAKYISHDIDIFGDIQILISAASASEIYSHQIKLDYTGSIVSSSKLISKENSATSPTNAFAVYPTVIHGDASGDTLVSGFSAYNQDTFTLYHFDGTNGSTSVTDASYNKRNGVTFGGAATISTAQYKHGISSLSIPDGSSDAFSIPAAATPLGNLMSNTYFTLEAFFRSGSTGGTNPVLFSCGTVGSTNHIKLSYNRSTGVITLQLRGSGSVETIGNSSSSAFTSNTWHHIALVKDNLDYRVYLNGARIITGSSATSVSTPNSLYIGSAVGVTQPLNGYVDEFRISPTARYTGTSLTSQQVTATTSQFSAGNILAKDGVLIKIDKNREANKLGTYNTTYATIIASINSGGFAVGQTINYGSYSASIVAYSATTGLTPVATITISAPTGVIKPGDTITGSLPAGNATVTSVSYTYNYTYSTISTWSNINVTATSIDEYVPGVDNATILDFNESNSTLGSDYLTCASTSNIWANRTATVPTPGGIKLKANCKKGSKFYIKNTNVSKFKNIKKFTLNQIGNFTPGATISEKVYSTGLKTANATITKVDKQNKLVYVAYSTDATTFSDQTTVTKLSELVSSNSDDVNTTEQYAVYSYKIILNLQSGGVGTFTVGNKIKGQTSGATAVVTAWDSGTRTLTLENYNGSFVSGENINELLNPTVIWKLNTTSSTTPVYPSVGTSGTFTLKIPNDDAVRFKSFAEGTYYVLINELYSVSNWTASTSYAVDTYVTNTALGTVYRSTVAGTTGSSAPGHTSGTASDNTITWEYVGTQKVSNYFKNSLISPDISQITLNASPAGSQKTILTITGLTLVKNITIITEVDNIIRIIPSGISSTDEVFVTTDTAHYLSSSDIIQVEGNGSVGSASEYDGSFNVDSIISSRSFTYLLKNVATSNPGSASGILLYAKSPVLNFIYGHQYNFDLSHPSNYGYFLSFSRDSLNKIEYSFNNIVRLGTPGVDSAGSSPKVTFKVDELTSSITYYFDPSHTGDESPVTEKSYAIVRSTPYSGKFTIYSVSGGTVTSGNYKFSVVLPYEPEGAAIAENSSYTTTSTTASGPISDIEFVSSGGFYKKLPIVTSLVAIRTIERVQIENQGTEYQPGIYTRVPINGDGVGGYVEIEVTLEGEPGNETGKITSVALTSAGKGYTYGSIDIDGIPGILGSQLQGGGGKINVIVPSLGSGASIYLKGSNVGKIKKLKNNNFGFGYSHDYTLKPEINFPINLQLLNTSILSSIKVTNPGSGYTVAPAVVITGGGGTGAAAEAVIKNGRISTIEIKNAGDGYSSAPKIALKSSFTFVVNVDLNYLQFTSPHGIPNGALVTFAATEGTTTIGTPELPLTSFGRLTASQTYYAIAGTDNSLDDNQLKIALTPQGASIGDAITFINNGNGRLLIFTESFGGAAEAIVETARFLSDEYVYQGNTFNEKTAYGYVSKNGGWQEGPRLLKLENYSGEFIEGQKVIGLISKASGIINNISRARGVLNINSVTQTTGKFLDDTGKPSEIIQRLQDSYYYQNFSYAIKSSVVINKWRDSIKKNVHPAGFQVFGELTLESYQETRKNDPVLAITRGVNVKELADFNTVESFAIVEPKYSEFDNSVVIFRSKKLTSSEQIITSTVQELDDISDQFDGSTTAFPLTIAGETATVSADKLLISLNGIVQAPGKAYNIVNGLQITVPDPDDPTKTINKIVQGIVFSDPPQPATTIKYVQVIFDKVFQSTIWIDDAAGVIPDLGRTIVGQTSKVRASIISSESVLPSVSFDGSSSRIVDVTTNTITVEKHSFLTGTEVRYTVPTGVTPLNPVPAGTGTTLYAIRVDDSRIKLANTFSNALAGIAIDITTLGTNRLGYTQDHTVTNLNGITKLTVANYISSTQTGASEFEELEEIRASSTGLVATISRIDNLNHPSIGRYRNASDLITSNNSEIVSKAFTDLQTYIFANYPDFVYPGAPTNSYRFKDAYRLIQGNKQYIIDTTSSRIESQYPTFTFGADPTSTTGVTSLASNRYQDAKNLILANRAEILDRSLAEIAVQYPDFVYPGDPASDSHSRFNDAYRLIQQNKDEIADKALAEIAVQYPDFYFPGDTQSDSHSRFNDAYRLIQQNRDEILDRSIAQIAIDHPDFVFPGDANTNASSRFNDAYRLIQQNKDEIADRALAEIALQYADFYFPGDTRSDTHSRFNDAYRLIQQNRDEIVEIAWSNMLSSYPSAATTELKCKRDIGYFIDAVSLDVFLEGNKYTRKFVQQYFNNGVPIINGLVGEEAASNEAFNQAKTLMKKAVTNQLTIKDLTLTPDPATGSNTSALSCANVRTSIDTLTSIVTSIITAGSISGLPSENAGSYVTNELKCRRDITYFIDAVSLDVFLEGNKYIRKFVLQYFNNVTPITNGIVDEEEQTIVALNMARDMMKKAVTNQLYVKDLTLTPDPATASNTSALSCANVRAAIDTLTSIATLTFEAQDPNLIPLQNVGSYQSNELKCRRDVGYFVDAVSLDTFLEGNKYTRKFVQQYFVNGQPLTNGLLGEYAQSISAFNMARDMMKKAITNQLYTKDLTLTADSSPTSGSISNVNPLSCANVQTTISNLTLIVTNVFGVGGYASLPSENAGSYVTNELKCRRDINYFIDAVSLDIFLETNKYSRKFVLQYFNRGIPISNGLTGELAQSVVAFNMARDMMKKAITNQLYTKDLTLTADPVTQSNISALSCANVRTAIDTLSSIITITLSAGSTSSLPSESTSQFNTNELKCRRDIGYIVDAIAADLASGGNASILAATKAYFTNGGVPLTNGLVGETAQSVVAFNMARDMMKKALTNQLYTKDLSISSGPATENGTGGNIQNLQSGNANTCTDVQSSVSSLVLILTTAISAGNLNSLPTLLSPAVLAAKAKCKRDIGYIIDAISQDLYDGNNTNTITAITAYFNNGILITNGVLGEQTQSVYAFNQVKDLMQQAVTNQLPFKDLTITADTATGSNISVNSCANVRSTITTLSLYLTTALTNNSLSGLPSSIISNSPYSPGEIKCKRDIGYITTALAADISSGGNSNIWENTKYYFTAAGSPLSNGLVGEEIQGIYGFQRAAYWAGQAVNNQLTVKDLSIIADPSPEQGLASNTNPYGCTDVRNSLTTLVSILNTAIQNGNLSSLPLRNPGNWSSITNPSTVFEKGETVVNLSSKDAEVEDSNVTIFALDPCIIAGTTSFTYTASNGITQTGLGSKTIKLPSGDIVSGLFADAANGIRLNADFIAQEALGYVKSKYPDLIIPVSDSICARDIGYVVSAIADDIQYGGNYRIVDSALSYYNGTTLRYINNQILETIDTYVYARNLAIAAMRSWKVKLTAIRTGTTTITLINQSTINVVEGMTVTGTGIPSNTKVSKILDSTRILLTNSAAAATGSVDFVLETGKYAIGYSPISQPVGAPYPNAAVPDDTTNPSCAAQASAIATEVAILTNALENGIETLPTTTYPPSRPLIEVGCQVSGPGIDEDTVVVDVVSFTEILVNKTCLNTIGIPLSFRQIDQSLVLSKVTGTPNNPGGLFSLVNGDFVYGKTSGQIAKITTLGAYRDPVTGVPINDGQPLQINEGTSFSGLIFNRILDPQNPNVIVDDISESSAKLVDPSDTTLAVNTNFLEYQSIENNTITYTPIGSTEFNEGETISSIKIKINGKTGNFTQNETLYSNKLSYKSISGLTYFPVIGGSTKIYGLTSGASASQLSSDPSVNTVYLGPITGSFTTGESIANWKVNVNGSTARLNTTYYKFGSASLRTLGSTDWVYVNDPNKFNLGSGDWTVECWIYPTTAATQTFADFRNSGGDTTALTLVRNSSGTITLTYNSTSWTTTATAAINSWSHIAISKSSNSTQIYVNGIGVATAFADTRNYASRPLTIGNSYQNTSGNGFTGYIDDFRISTTARYTNNFTAPAAEFTQDSYTLVLFNFNGANNSSTILPTSYTTATVCEQLTVPFIAKQVNNTSNLIYADAINTALNPYREASSIILKNSLLIAEEASSELKAFYTNFQIPGDVGSDLSGTSTCRRDLELLISAVAQDLATGGDYYSISAAKAYIQSNEQIRYLYQPGVAQEYGVGQLLQSLHAHFYTRDLCVKAVRNTLVDYVTQYTQEVAVSTLGTQIASSENAIASRVEYLWGVINDVLAPTGQRYRDACNLLWFNRNFIAEEAVAYTTDWFKYTLNGVQYNALTFPGGSAGQTKCKRDMKLLIDTVILDLLTGGQGYTVDGLKFYLADGVSISSVKGELLATIVTLQKIKTLAQAVINNEISVGQYQTTYSPVRDYTITNDPGGCANVKSAIATLYDVMITFLRPAGQNYQDATKLALFNKEYIISETHKYITNTYTTLNLTTSEIATGKAALDDYIDAVIYDLLTNGNYGIVSYTSGYLNSTGTAVTSFAYKNITATTAAYNKARDYIISAINKTLVSPSPLTSFYAYTDSSINVTAGPTTKVTAETLILTSTLSSPQYLALNVTVTYGVSLPTANYGTRNLPNPVIGGLNLGNYVYGGTSGSIAEVTSIINRNARVTKIYTRFEVLFTNAGEMFDILETITNETQSGTATVYSYEVIDDLTYVDLIINSGNFAEDDVITGLTTDYSATIQTTIQNRLTLIDINSQIENNEYFTGLTTGAQATLNTSYYNTAPVVSNSGGKLVLETEGISGYFFETQVVNSSDNEIIVDILEENQSVELTAGDYIVSRNINKMTVDIDQSLSSFEVGDTISLINPSTEVNIGDQSVVVGIENNEYATVIFNNGISGTFTIGDYVKLHDSQYSEVANANVVSWNATSKILKLDNLVEVTSGRLYAVRGVQVANSPSTNFGLLTSLTRQSYIYYTDTTSTVPSPIAFGIGGTIVNKNATTQNVVGIGTISALQTLTTNRYAYGKINKIIEIGNTKKLYLTSVVGTFENYSRLIARDGYHAYNKSTTKITGRIDRYFRGFDGTQATFSLTSNNGTQYFPNSEGYVLIFVNGILQQPAEAYITFSDKITFSEAPAVGSSFVGIYLGKMRILDDISFEFDSLRSSFNLKRGGSFYSLTVTEGSAEDVKPDNNIIVSLNGVIQKSNEGYTLSGSRINFSEVPRTGGQFIGFAYIGSDADVVQDIIVPEVESGDILLIEGETENRTVAVIESSSSLVTYNYEGPVYGKSGILTAVISKGLIKETQVSSGGSGYTSRPEVTVTSTGGFDGQLKALVGVSSVNLLDAGYGYKEPQVVAATVDLPNAQIVLSGGTTFGDFGLN